MFSETREGPAYNIATPKPELAVLAQEYVGACDRFDQLQREYHKINDELKSVDDARRQLRDKLLSLINEAIDGPQAAAAKARLYSTMS